MNLFNAELYAGEPYFKNAREAKACSLKQRKKYIHLKIIEIEEEILHAAMTGMNYVSIKLSYLEKEVREHFEEKGYQYHIYDLDRNTFLYELSWAHTGEKNETIW